MDILCRGLRDRRQAASDETISVADKAIFAGGSIARARGAVGLRRTDRPAEQIRAIILHQTWGRTFLPGTRSAYPRDRAGDANVRSHHAIDRVAAHFVVLNDGTIFYTHDIEYVINSAGRRYGIDIEFAGRFTRTRRLSVAAIRSGRELLRVLTRRLPEITHVHPHGQVQRRDAQGLCGGATGNRCDKHDTCPGPDVWVNVGEWAVRSLGLTADTTLPYYQNNGISDAQRDRSFDQDLELFLDEIYPIAAP